jgi:hypothetical protein
MYRENILTIGSYMSMICGRRNPLESTPNGANISVFTKAPLRTSIFALIKPVSGRPSRFGVLKALNLNFSIARETGITLKISESHERPCRSKEYNVN